MKFISFTEHLLESNSSDFGKTHPIQIILRGVIGLTAKTEEFTRKSMNLLYKKYIQLVLIKGVDELNDDDRIPPHRQNKIDYKYPILNFTARMHDYLKKGNIYNPINALELSADKKEFHKLFKNANFVPTAVFSLKDIEDLALPIIAKPKDGFSAQGIELFKTYDDARKSKLKFDLWSEAKDIDREFRAFVMNGEIIHISERISNTSTKKDVGEKDPDDKIDLIYIDQKIDGFPHNTNLNKILKEIEEKKIGLDFYNIDLILDKSGKLWVPELNGAPGIGPSMFHSIYKSWLKLAYDVDIPNDVDDELADIAASHRKMMSKEYPKEFKSSLHPIEN